MTAVLTLCLAYTFITLCCPALDKPFHSPHRLPCESSARAGAAVPMAQGGRWPAPGTGSLALIRTCGRRWASAACLCTGRAHQETGE